MIEIFPKNKEAQEAFLRRYVKRLGDLRKRYYPRVFEKQSAKKREVVQRAILRQKYAHPTVFKRSLGMFLSYKKNK